MLKVGLTGGIASGKSSVLGIFDEQDVPTLSADRIVHTLLEDDRQVQQRVVDAFGDEILNASGDIDRARLGQVVFADPEKRRDLESILHPLVTQQTIRWFDMVSDARIAVVEMPLLYEAGLESLFDVVVAVWTEHAIQENRLLSKGFSLEEANNRINAQMPLGEKARMADFTIHNTGSLGQLRDQVNRLMKDLLTRNQAG